MSESQRRKKYVYNPETGRKFVINGCMLSDNPPVMGGGQNNYMFDQYQGQMPSSVDLRPFMTRVEDQSQTSSCVANSIVGALEYFLKLDYNQEIDMSRLFLYYNARLRNAAYQTYMKDGGCYVSDGLAALQSEGVCKEYHWPFQGHLINYRPRPDCYSKVYRNPTIQGERLPNHLGAMKSALVQGHPIVIGLLLYQSFYSAEWNGGWVPMPNQYEGQLQQHGAHAMLVVGYDDSRQTFIVRNSWGERWGDRGYCYMPYAYLTNQQLCLDLYAIQSNSVQRLQGRHLITDQNQFYFGSAKPTSTTEDEKRQKKLEIIDETTEEENKRKIDEQERSKIITEPSKTENDQSQSSQKGEKEKKVDDDYWLI